MSTNLGSDGSLGRGSLPASELSVMEVVVHAVELQLALLDAVLHEVESEQVLE